MKGRKLIFSASLVIYLVGLIILFQGAIADDHLPEGAIARFSPGDSVFTVAFSPDGKLLASGGDDNAVILWDVATRKERKVFTEHSDSVMSVVFSPDGEHLASASLDGFVRLWDVSKKRKHTTFVHTHSGWAKTVAFSPDGKTLATGGGDQIGSIVLWDIPKNRRIAAIQGHSGIVESVAFSPNGQRVASASRDKTVKLWSAEGQHLRKTLRNHQNVVYAVAFSPDGELLATSSRDKTVKLYKVVSGENVTSFFLGRDRYVYVEALAFSPDGNHLASGCVDNSVRLWNVDDQREVATIRGHSGGVTSIAFSPDGSTLASGSRDRTVLLWDLAYFNIRPSDPIPVPQPVLEPVPAAVVDNTTSPQTPDLTPADPIRSSVSDPIVVDTTTTPTPVDLKPDSRVIPNPRRRTSVDKKPETSNTPPVPDPIVVDTTPPNIVILSPTGRIVPWNTQELLIQGKITDDNSIGKVKVNGREVWISAEGKFTTTVPLTTGENEIRVVATDAQRNMETHHFSVTRPGDDHRSSSDLDPPTLSLDMSIPTETEDAYFAVHGSVSDNSGIGGVKVNDMVVFVSANGGFTITVPLDNGGNEIRVTVVDTHGNMETHRFTVFRKAPPLDDVGPEIRILEPVYNRTRGIRREIHINATSVTVLGTVTDASGITVVNVDGTAAQRTGIHFTAEVQLMHGKNVIHITASDEHGNDSDKEIIVFRPYSDPILRKGKDYALLFAVEDYNYWEALHKPVSDAETIAHDLKTLYGFQTRLIKNPTRADIFNALREYAEMDYSDDDQLFIFFAGHGYFDDTFKGGYLVARDTQLPNQDEAMLGYVSHSVVRDIIDAMNCKHILVVLDTCYSGTFDRLIAMRGNAADMPERRLTEADIHRIFQYTTRWYLTSGGKEIVYDESPFVHQFLEALRSKGGSDNILTIDEILSYVRRLVNPKPRASGFGSDEPGSDFLFITIE